MRMRNTISPVTASSSSARAAAWRCRRAAAAPAFRVLVFLPIGKEHATIASRTCQTITRTANASLFLIHYDDSQAYFAREPWYARVEFTAVAKVRAIKIVLARQFLVLDERMRLVILQRFSHVWVTDDDVSFPSSHAVGHFLRVAARLDAAIVQPATEASTHTLVRPRSDCSVATPTDFVEHQSTLMERCVFMEAVGVLHKGTRSDYGLDRVWCRWFARPVNHSRWNLCTACAVIQVAGFVKHYGTTHKHSYNVSAAMEDDRRLRSEYSLYESLCTVVGSCRNGPSPHSTTFGDAAAAGQAAARTSSLLHPPSRRMQLLNKIDSSHRRMPYRVGTCTAPRPGLVVNGPCGMWRSAAPRQHTVG